jgi:magnesium chelatase family protein
VPRTSCPEHPDKGRFDLPIALGILAATGQIPGNALAQYEFAGELVLTGKLRAVRGALAMALGASRDARRLLLPAVSAAEAAMVRGTAVFGTGSLLAVCAHLTARHLLPQAVPVPARPDLLDLAEVRGQAHA